MPKAIQIAVLVNPANSFYRRGHVPARITASRTRQWASSKSSMPAPANRLMRFSVRFARPADALLVAGDAFFSSRGQFATLTARQRPVTISVANTSKPAA